MDEAKEPKSQTQTKPESIADATAGSVETGGDIGMQAEASQTELSTPPGTRGDLPNDGLPAEEAHTAASESAMPDTGPPGENSQTGVGDGSDSQVAEFDQQNGADDPGFDRKGQDAETREAEISVGSDSSYAAKRPVLKAMVAAIAIAVLFGGFFVFDKKSGVKRSTLTRLFARP